MLPNRNVRTIGSIIRRPAPGRPPVAPDSVGIEVELEGYRGTDGQQIPRRMTQQWNFDRDGSLRNGGIEIKSRGPQEDYRRALSVLQEVLNDMEPQLIVNERCSVHVHLNFLDCIEEEVVNFLLLWTAMEGIMDTLSGDRIRNNYCLGVSEALESYQELVRDIISKMNSGDYWVMGNNMARPGDPIGRPLRPAGHGGDRDHNRYSACNLVRLRQYGTVEIRTMEGTLDMERVRRWVDYLQAMKRAACDRTISDVMVAIAQEPMDALYEIFGEDIARQMITESMMQDDQITDMFRKGYYRAVSLLHHPFLNADHVRQFIQEV